MCGTNKKKDSFASAITGGGKLVFGNAPLRKLRGENCAPSKKCNEFHETEAGSPRGGGSAEVAADTNASARGK